MGDFPLTTLGSSPTMAALDYESPGKHIRSARVAQFRKRREGADRPCRADGHTLQADVGFFRQNLVMEYSRERAVADGANVDGQVYCVKVQ